MSIMRIDVRLPAQPVRGSVEAIHRLLWPRFTGLRREHLWRVDLNGRDRILGAELVSIGSADATMGDPREIFAGALSARASKVVLVHNHPSGEVEPSPQDSRFFARIETCGTILGIEVIDQLIVHDERCFSLARSRKRPTLWKRQ